jgi:nucleoside-diphosphate-sugar epimerase
VRGEIVNIVGDKNVTIRQLAEMVTAVLPTSLEFGEPRPGEVPPASVSWAKAKELFDWEPTVEFRQGLTEIIEEHLGASKDLASNS